MVIKVLIRRRVEESRTYMSHQMRSTEAVSEGQDICDATYTQSQSIRVTQTMTIDYLIMGD